MLNEHTRNQITKMAAGLLPQMGLMVSDDEVLMRVPGSDQVQMAWYARLSGNLSQMKAVLSDFEERPAEVLHLIADGLRAKAKELERREPEPDGSEKLAHFAH